MAVISFYFLKRNYVALSLNRAIMAIITMQNSNKSWYVTYIHHHPLFGGTALPFHAGPFRSLFYQKPLLLSKGAFLFFGIQVAVDRLAVPFGVGIGRIGTALAAAVVIQQNGIAGAHHHLVADVIAAWKVSLRKIFVVAGVFQNMGKLSGPGK